MDEDEQQPEEQQPEELWCSLTEFFRQGQHKDHRLAWGEWAHALREYRKVN